MIPEIKENYKVNKIVEVLITELVMRKVYESTTKNKNRTWQ
jgi:hypothetical protein